LAATLCQIDGISTGKRKKGKREERKVHKERREKVKKEN
jgi:hypothetical protein